MMLKMLYFSLFVCQVGTLWIHSEDKHVRPKWDSLQSLPCTYITVCGSHRWTIHFYTSSPIKPTWATTV